MDLKIQIRDINEEGRDFEGETGPDYLEIENEVESLRPVGPIKHKLHISLISGKLLIAGSLEIDMEMRCVRCAEFFKTRIKEPNFELVLDVLGLGEYVDLTQSVREAILLAFPNFPVCSVDCKGLCPMCGADLNHVRCGCKPGIDLRWGGLDKLGKLK